MAGNGLSIQGEGYFRTTVVVDTASPYEFGPLPIPRSPELSWLSKIRLRVLAYLTGLTLAALGVLAITTIPAWGVWGMAMVVNRTAGRLSEPTCYGCGRSTENLPDGEHGVACPDCGTICTKPGKIDRA